MGKGCDLLTSVSWEATLTQTPFISFAHLYYLPDWHTPLNYVVVLTYTDTHGVTPPTHTHILSLLSWPSKSEFSYLFPQPHHKRKPEIRADYATASAWGIYRVSEWGASRKHGFDILLRWLEGWTFTLQRVWGWETRTWENLSEGRSVSSALIQNMCLLLNISVFPNNEMACSQTKHIIQDKIPPTNEWVASTWTLTSVWVWGRRTHGWETDNCASS